MEQFRKKILNKLKTANDKHHLLRPEELLEVEKGLFPKLELTFNFSTDDVYQQHLVAGKYVFLDKHSACPDFFNPDAQTFGCLVEGSSLLTMFLFQNIFQEKIDLIYTVPPYNSKTIGFMYQTDYCFSEKFFDSIKNIDPSHPFAHTKWLSMMQVRLEKCYQLLKSTGMIAISVNDQEMPHLKLLMDKIFTPNCYKGTIIWQRNTNAAVDTAKKLVSLHEYILIYEKELGQSKFYVEFKKELMEEPVLFQILSGGRKGRRQNSKGHWYSVKHQGKEIWPLNTKGIEQSWRLSKQTFAKLEEEQKIQFKLRKSDKQFMPYQIKKEKRKDVFALKSVLNDWPVIRGGNDLGKDLGKTLAGIKYWYQPKPVDLLVHLFKGMCPQNGIVLDFSAGAGTAACAVAKLNKEDGGKRQFVLIENHFGGDLNRTGKNSDLWQKIGNDKKHQICPFREVTYTRLWQNRQEYDLSCKTFLINDYKLSKLTGDEVFYTCPEEYSETCANLLSILNPKVREYDRKKAIKNHYQFQVDDLKYGLFGDQLDINMRFNFHLRLKK